MYFLWRPKRGEFYAELAIRKVLWIWPGWRIWPQRGWSVRFSMIGGTGRTARSFIGLPNVSISN
jgi:hypothetical protein